ncbi:B-cell receptor CD22-like isoform X5 [Oncorhynchus kisutch]|uniref:B-cell receptor CD22-like isoform X5 n=1 Tax=Oncorhynchus kisutch TaxID=8019 RepID=UPI0012DED6A5|nr:B-cell receptor CD22-like isoform X5 [Oncorhynchus kisutch]
MVSGYLFLVISQILEDYRVGDATMALRTAGRVLVVFLWSVTVVLGQDGWSVTYTTQSICTLKGSTVDLFCSYTYPRGKVTTTFWFTEWGTGVEPEDLGQDPEYAGRLEYHGDKKKDCTLKITDLRERDSATYKFRLLTDQEGGKFSGSPGATLSVTGLQVKLTGGYQDKTLTCSTTCTLTDNPTYIWYKNGQHLDESTSPQYKYSVSNDYDDSYSCAVKGHEDLHSPAVCVVGESCMNVTYTHQSICALKGSTVDISCFYTHPSWHNVTEVSWFNKWESGVTKDLSLNPEYADRVEYHRQTEKDSTLRITDLRESDSTEYKFKFTTDEARWGSSFPGTTLTVTGFQVEVTPKWSSEYKTLTCITTCTLSNPNPIYIWYKNGQHLDESTSPQYKDPVSSNHDDSYSCAVKGHEDLLSPAVCVQGQSCYRVTYTKRRICVLKGSTVDISCTYVGYYSTTSSFWFRSDKSTPEDLTRVPGYAGRVEHTGTYRGPSSLRITDLREEDSAEYRFTFKTNNFEWGHSFPGTTLSVTGLQVNVTPAVEGQKTLTCITTCTLTDNPTYIWYKNGQRLDEPTSQQYSSNILVVLGHSVDSYSCTVEHHEDLHSPAVYAPRNTSVSVSPSGEIVEGSSVTLTCSSDANPPVDKYTWYKKNVTSPKASGQSYNITNISSEDRGEYYCEAQNGRGSMNSTALMIIIAGKQTSVLTAAVGIIVVVLVLILCLSGLMCFRSFTGGSDASTDTQSVRPDCNSDTYTALNMRTMSPDYDTLISVHPDPNSDTYTPLNMKTRSPEYDTLANVRGISH